MTQHRIKIKLLISQIVAAVLNSRLYRTILGTTRFKMAEKKEDKVLPYYKDSGYGFNINGEFSLEAFESALRYQPRPDDLFIVTCPKSGTTWVQNIVACIYRDGKPFDNAVEFLTNFPFLEMSGAEAAETMKRPGAIKMHLPYHLVPRSSEAKYIFVTRNPKDVVVSFYHHTRNISRYRFQNGSFDDFFDLFMEGKTDFGDYFDTLLSWYDHRNDPNVLFITYEQLQKDTKACVLKIAEFLGQKYKDMLMQDEKMLNDVIKYSSFEYMKESLNGQMSELAKLDRDFVLNHPDLPQGLRISLGAGGSTDGNPWVREGVVGGYKSYLSPEQNRRLEEKFRVRTEGTDIPELWKDIINVDSEDLNTDTFTPSSKPPSQIVMGLKFPAMFVPSCIRSAMAYKPRPDDVFIATYPKCGTTWTQQILLLIFSHGQPLASQMEFFAKTPFLEFTGAAGGEQMPRPGAIKLHLPYDLTPKSDKAKYIYVTRNPKDCCVSFFHHMSNMPGHLFTGTFDDFFELFISGDTDYGDYFDHLLGWYAHRNDPNVLFITYEEIKAEPKEAVLKIASFIDDKLYAEPLRNDPEKLQNVLKYSSLDYMKKTLNKTMDDLFKMSKEEILNTELPNEMKKLFSRMPEPQGVTEKAKKSEFVRKGIVGDWKNHFTEEQSKKLKEKFYDRTKGTDIPKLWEKYM